MESREDTYEGSLLADGSVSVLSVILMCGSGGTCDRPAYSIVAGLGAEPWLLGSLGVKTIPNRRVGRMGRESVSWRAAHRRISCAGVRRVCAVGYTKAAGTCNGDNHVRIAT